MGVHASAWAWKQAVSAVGAVWTDEELREWLWRHTDAFHPPGPERCSDCRESLRLYGPLPPPEAIRDYARRSRPPRTAVERRRSQWERRRKKIRPLVLARDGSACVLCGEREQPLHVDHSVPISKGGSDDLSNLRTLCRPCNCRRGNREA